MNGAVAVSILIPAWEEEAAIGAVVADALASCHGAAVAAECLVCVDERTSDDTAEVARRAGGRPVLQDGRGLTAAVLQVAVLAAGEVCVVLDGDGQHDAGSVARLAAPLLAGEADLVTGARDPESLRSGFGAGWRGATRYAGARILGCAARLAVRGGVPDPLTGMFACRRGDLLGLRAWTRAAPPCGYKLLLGLLAMMPRARMRHVTVPFLPRCGGGSKLDASVALTTLRQLVVVFVSGRSATRPRGR